jgi:hypothetical protein
MTPLDLANLYLLEAGNIRKGLTREKFAAATPEQQKAFAIRRNGFMPPRAAARERVRAKYFSRPDLVNKARAMRKQFTPRFRTDGLAEIRAATMLVEAALASRQPRGYSLFGVRPSRNALCMPRRGSIF